jgi:DNA mismatch repair protein MutL
MADIIQLLPDAIANQIAAGEVIQRPASAVKELMENAIDAGSTSIKLIVKDAGKTLIQIIDNGCGMSETDARLSFERHATSKIRKTEDLFAIRTMGFRGEALASVAAVAQVEMRTRRQIDELGVRLVIEGSEVKTQEACQCAAGTSIAVKNLFYNVPARRNFLKSNSVEMRHIMEEFQRIAMANPDLFLSLHHNEAEVFHLPPGNLRQRLTALFGSAINKKLVPVEQETEVLKLNGFIGKPEFAKKSRGEQFFFVNQRFIRSSYLNHAIVSAFEGLLPEGAYPFYAIFIDIDPASIDINVHPTKQEIKFEDERLVYDYLKVALRHSLGQYSVMPTLDFESDANFGMTRSIPQARNQETVQSASRPASPSAGSALPPEARQQRANNLKNWELLYEGLDEAVPPRDGAMPRQPESLTIESNWSEEGQPEGELQLSGGEQPQKAPYQVHGIYIVSQIKSGILLIDQQAAHERILYERYLQAMQQQKGAAQQQLFPRTLTLSPIDAALLQEILEQINLLGFDIQEFGANTFVINGLPSELAGKRDEVKVIESLLEQYKRNLNLKLDIQENIARAMARSAAIKPGQALSAQEMQALIDKLFACEVPFKSPSGKNCFITFELESLAKRFEG